MSESTKDSRIIDFGNGSRSIQTPGWEWGTEDVAAVLQAHGNSAAHELSSPVVQHAFDLCVANERRIQKAVLAYDDMEDQIDAFMGELEDILVEAGLLSGDTRHFSGPEQSA